MSEDQAEYKAEASDIAKLFARVFRGDDGDRALAHLRKLTIDRRMPPACSDAELRHIEGQRFLAQYIENMTKQGRTG